MHITYLGHAGLFIETQFGSILCDPWYTPAYFSSWFPFPDNEALVRKRIGCHPTYLFVSHLHQDHCDVEFLRDQVWKNAIVLLPEYPLPLLERTLRAIGFDQFQKTKSGQWVHLDQLKIMTLATTSPSDGPLGDCALVVDDGETRIFNQNDARPLDLTPLFEDDQPVSAHFLQFSGAIWYPMAYDYPEKMKKALGAKKRENEMARALHYIEQVNALHVFPSSGPACFLDPEHFHYNDCDRDETNTFPDQVVFLEYLQAHHHGNGQLLIPESTLTFEQSYITVKHPHPEAAIRCTMFDEKRHYLEDYQKRRIAQIEAQTTSLQIRHLSLVTELQVWFEPLLRLAPTICACIHGTIIIDCDDEAMVIDPLARRVYAWDHQPSWSYYFHIRRSFVEHCIVEHQEDWVNSLFLSFRFMARRKGVFNEYVYTFFKCLSEERLRYAEAYYQGKIDGAHATTAFFESHGYRLQRQCPHAGADLSRYASFDLEQGILSCHVHGWQFHLEDGTCLTSHDHHLDIQAAPDQVKSTGTHIGIRSACHNCWFRQRNTQPSQKEKDSVQ